MDNHGHEPVLLSEVLSFLRPQSGDVVVDGTFGGGGYARAILDSASCRVVAFDRDPLAIDRAALFAGCPGRFHFVFGASSTIVESLEEIGISAIDGLVMDLGVSSFQLDDASRGFSFRHSGPLDMRMGQSGLSAADIVNEWSEAEIADLLFTYGEERRARRIARAIVEGRNERPFTTTTELAELVVRVIGVPLSAARIHPATRTFQALRIAVNDELGELSKTLDAAETVLRVGGRIVVVSFHSLEDRIVKAWIATRMSGGSRESRHLPARKPDGPNSNHSVVRTLTRRPVTAGAEETHRNPKSRSAKLRAAEILSRPKCHDD